MTTDQSLVFSGADPDHIATLSTITLLNAECISPGSSTDPYAVYVCEVVDRRHLLGLIPLDKAYNLVSADGTVYFSETLNAAVAWTWQEIVTDIATVVGINPLTLPFTPNDTPENFIFWGRASALECLCDVLDRLGCDLAYDNIANTFTIARLGVDQDSDLDEIDAQRLWDGYSSEATRGWRPEKVRVRFPRRPVDAASGFTPYYTKDVTLAAAVGVKTGTYVQIDDGLTALGASGAPTNAAALSTQADERATDWLRKRQYYDRPVLRAWRDFVPDATGLGGYAVRKIVFDDRGGLMQTWANSSPERAMEDWRPLGGWPVWYPLAASGGGVSNIADVATLYDATTVLGLNYYDIGSTGWEDTGLAILLPEAGTYQLWATVAALGQVSSLGVEVFAEILAKIINQTANTTNVSGAMQITALNLSNTDLQLTSSTISGFITVSGAAELRLQAIRSNGSETWTTHVIQANTNFANQSTTQMGYMKIDGAMTHADSGVIYPGTAAGVTNSSVNNTPWSNPNNIKAEDGATADVALVGENSGELRGTNFGFAIPAGAFIVGIQVSIGEWQSAGGGSLVDQTVRLRTAAGAMGDNKASTTTWPTGAIDERNYGNPIDMWGRIWTPAEINDPAFGVSLIATATGSATASVDWFRITVSYVTPP